MASELWGKLIGDRGYLSQPLFEKLYQQGLQLITPIRKNMRNRLNLAQVKLLLHRRTVIETIIDQLKNISQVVHSHYLTPIPTSLSTSLLVCLPTPGSPKDPLSISLKRRRLSYLL